MSGIFRNLAILLVAMFSAPLLAQTITIENESGAPGQVVVVTVSYTAGSNVAGLDMDLGFTASQFSSVTVNCNVQTVGADVNFCSNSQAASGIIAITMSKTTLGENLVDGILAEVSFTIANNATFGPVTLTGTMIGLSDNQAQDIPLNTVTITNGTLTVVGPVYGSTPAAGALNVGSVAQGGTDPSVNVVINNTGGATGSTLTGTCSETADPDGVFTLSGLTAFSVPQAGPTDTVTVTCDSAGSIANHTGTMSCAHNGTNTTPQVYNLSCDITAGPQPSFSSNPAPGVITLGPVEQGGTAPTQNILISNGGDVSTTLDGTCAMGVGDLQITLTSDGAFSVLQGGAADTQTVSCSTAEEGSYSRTLNCPHDGSNASPAVFTVNCTIDPPPAPEYSSTPAIGATLDFGGIATEQGDTDPTDTVSITNTGETGSQLGATCTDTVDANNVFTVTNGVVTNLLTTSPAHVVTVSCDSAAQGSYVGTLSCDHNGETATDPATYPLSCEIGPPGAAIYESDPAPGATIDLTPSPVAQGTDVPVQTLTITNGADPEDSDLEITCALSGNAPPISSTPDLSGFTFIAPGESQVVSFDCDTTNVGVNTATYTCGYNVAPPVGAVEAPQSPALSAVYTVECEVRAPMAVVLPLPPSGTLLQAVIEPGGSHTFTVDFDEIAGEGVDAQLTSCTLATGTDFAILSPTFPAVIPAGGLVTVSVEGTDPGGVDEFSDTLTCTYSDTANPNGIEVSYPLTLIVGGNATFNVTKEFTDGQNPTEVDVTISCFTGLPLVQSQTISATQDVTFIVTNFDSGELDCEITEDLTTLEGYTPTYEPTGENVNADGGCNFADVTGGSENLCHIVNDADPVEVVIEKLWVIDGVGADQVDQQYVLTLYCDTAAPDQSQQAIVPLCGNPTVEAPNGDGPAFGFCQVFQGNGTQTFTAHVVPEYPGNNCWVEETVFDSSAEVDNDCQFGSLPISAGQGASCTITNSVFFEGIPTLSQFGMAILALLMLGVGLVGFRRFA